MCFILALFGFGGLAVVVGRFFCSFFFFNGVLIRAFKNLFSYPILQALTKELFSF